ncbi:MAG: hypothetical protein MJ231_06545 [bacterium]|nr:hypothetical protein [bacterium]
MKKELSFYPSLYIGKSIKPKKVDKIKRKLAKKPLLCSQFLITIASNPKDQLDIFSARQLVQSYYDKYPPYIIGIAADYDEAVEIVELIVKECYLNRGDYSLREFLLC